MGLKIRKGRKEYEIPDNMPKKVVLEGRFELREQESGYHDDSITINGEFLSSVLTDYTEYTGPPDWLDVYKFIKVTKPLRITIDVL